jgi:hypothetical protein
MRKALLNLSYAAIGGANVYLQFVNFLRGFNLCTFHFADSSVKTYGL